METHKENSNNESECLSERCTKIGQLLQGTSWVLDYKNRIYCGFRGDKKLLNCKSVIISRDQSLLKERCAICIENYKSKDVLLKLRCKHLFHADCILACLKTKRACPRCRGKINVRLNHQIVAIFLNQIVVIDEKEEEDEELNNCLLIHPHVARKKKKSCFCFAFLFQKF